MSDLFGRPWEARGYADIVRASLSGDHLHVEFANGDHVEVPTSRLGLTGALGVDLGADEGLDITVHTSNGPVAVGWTQLRAASDPTFAQEMRRRDAEEARRIGLRLRALREDRGISQRHLAGQLAMPAAQLAKIESGTFDLRLSTVHSLLRAMGASLADIAGPNIPEVSTREIARHVRAAGVPKYVIDRIIGAVPRSDVTNAIAWTFGWTPSDFLAGPPESPPLQAAIQFKTGDPEAAASSPLLVMAHRLSERIVQAAPSVIAHANVPTNPRELRSAAANGAGQLTLASLLEWSWAAGIPVIPVVGSGAFAAASWVVDARYVIVLKDSRSLAAFWLFDLAHELGHIALGHVRDRGIVDVDEPTPKHNIDSQEEEANQFALELLLPRHRALLDAIRQDARGDYLRFKFSVQRVAQRARVSESLLGMVAAYELTEVGQDKDRWGSATNLARPEGAGRPTVQRALTERISLDRSPSIERDLINALLLSD